ncbi:hypothetical protein K491DRAFT_704878 [Lophiostoma macrostomum CBS 122681]|uniref:Rhodopsin domain-containing protein n=1 Tax=Lophiostoma macrostomum CBS 122681 TaxID=1314788 RepID=A0A6A6T6S8_9PLEO|nr:hypothetical protein K491DRAFT_704878 [Lophiostoma macrostomum CBS 122681]
MAAVDANLIPSPPTAGAVHDAQSFAAVAITLNIIAFFVFAGRIYTRCYPVFRLSIDDYVIAVAYILVLVDSVLLLNTVPFVFGSDPSKVTLADVQDSFRYATISEPIWAWAMCAIKVSVALMLLRLETGINMRRFLWANIAIQITLGIYNMIMQLIQCVPLAGAWDLLGTLNAKCWSADMIRTNLICVSSINIASDFLFALLPINFLRKVQRPLRERAIIGCLMALGTFAGVASIIKVNFGANFGRTSDSTREGINIGMWSSVEELCGIIAACVPCLRSPFQRALKYFGLVSTHKTTYAHTYGQMHDRPSKLRSTTRKSSAGGVAIQMKSMRSVNADAQSEENILPSDQAKDGEIWCTTEVTMEEEESKTPRMGSSRHGRGRAAWNDEEAGPLPAR